MKTNTCDELCSENNIIVGIDWNQSIIGSLNRLHNSWLSNADWVHCWASDPNQWVISEWRSVSKFSGLSSNPKIAISTTSQQKSYFCANNLRVCLFLSNRLTLLDILGSKKICGEDVSLNCFILNNVLNAFVFAFDSYLKICWFDVKHNLRVISELIIAK